MVKEKPENLDRGTLLNGSAKRKGGWKKYGLLPNSDLVWGGGGGGWGGGG